MHADDTTLTVSLLFKKEDAQAVEDFYKKEVVKLNRVISRKAFYENILLEFIKEHS